MLTQEKVVEILRRENEYLRHNYYVKRIGLFGSFAKGEQRENSDIDIFVEFEEPMGFKFIEFAEYIEKILGRKVDIITPAGIRGIRLGSVVREIEKSIRYV